MYPPAFPHDELAEIFPGVYLLRGSIRMAPGVFINRNMVVLQDGDTLTLVNPVRMNAQGLAQLDGLGAVRHIVRLGNAHGLDDAFYLDRYQCAFWAQAGQKTYPAPVPTHTLVAGDETPFPGSTFFVFELARYPEAALLIKAHRLLITTDSLQYYRDRRHFSLPAMAAFRFIGFRSGMNIGPPWRKYATPRGGSLRSDFDRLLQLDFDALVGAHGELLPAGAKDAVRREVARVIR